mgnify:CR=1 FL=1|jgi:murein hydrolase activator
MSNVNSRIILFSFFCFAFTLVKAQSSSSKLKKEQERLEAKISDTKSLLNKTKNNTEASLSELKLIESQIKFREELVANFDSQIRAADKEVSKKQEDIVELRLKLEEMKEQYKKMLLYAYKHRNKYGEMMQIISSESFHEAKKRKKYIEKLAALQQQQVFIIQQNEELLKNEIAFIEEEKQRKLAVLLEKKKEKESILQDKNKQEEVYQKFKNKEAELIVELQEDELKKEDLKDRINKAIRKEIEQANKKAEEEALKRKKAAEAAREKEKERLAALALSEKQNDNSTTNIEEPESMESIIFKDVNENIALDKNFQANRGKLPWPVEKGTITESFGKNAHPTLENVFTNNSGIDITTPRSAQVRAVFEGEVTSILNIPGAGKVVIIKHGNYRTVYTNLQNTYVSAGMKVDTKQAIGSLIVSTNSQFSIAHFEIHQVIDNNVQCINPILWINN